MGLAAQQRCSSLDSAGGSRGLMGGLRHARERGGQTHEADGPLIPQAIARLGVRTSPPALRSAPLALPGERLAAQSKAKERHVPVAGGHGARVLVDGGLGVPIGAHGLRDGDHHELEVEQLVHAHGKGEDVRLQAPRGTRVRQCARVAGEATA